MIALVRRKVSERRVNVKHKLPKPLLLLLLLPLLSLPLLLLLLTF